MCCHVMWLQEDSIKVPFVFSFGYMQERRALLTALLTEKRTLGRKRRARRGMLLYFILPKCNHLECKRFQLLSPAVIGRLAHWGDAQLWGWTASSPAAAPPTKLCAWWPGWNLLLVLRDVTGLTAAPLVVPPARGGFQDSRSNCSYWLHS